VLGAGHRRGHGRNLPILDAVGRAVVGEQLEERARRARGRRRPAQAPLARSVSATTEKIAGFDREDGEDRRFERGSTAFRIASAPGPARAALVEVREDHPLEERAAGRDRRDGIATKLPVEKRDGVREGTLRRRKG
jgi:hypothetical protein